MALVICSSPEPTPGLKEAWERGDRYQFLVDTLEEPIRYTEGKSIGIRRSVLVRGTYSSSTFWPAGVFLGPFLQHVRAGERELRSSIE